MRSYKMFQLKKERKKEPKEVSIKELIFIVIALTLIIYFILGDNIQIKVFFGALFFIIQGIFSIRENWFAALFEIVAGVMGLLVLFLTKQPLLFLNGFYACVLLMLFGFLYIHRKMRLQPIKNKLKIIYHLSYIFISLCLTLMVVVMLKSTIFFGFQKTLLLTEYIFIIELSFISIITFFLLTDNIIRIIPIEARRNLIGEYSAAHAAFFSLCLTILIGGYFYINVENNIVLQKILIVLGAAFLTSLMIANSLKNLFE